MYRKIYIYGLELFAISGIHEESWNVSPADKGGLLYIHVFLVLPARRAKSNDILMVMSTPSTQIYKWFLNTISSKGTRAIWGDKSRFQGWNKENVR